MYEPKNDNFWLTVVLVAAGAAVAGGLIAMYVMGKKVMQPQALGTPVAALQMPATGLPVPSRPAIMTNMEEITWTDWKGRERKISVHREVH